MTAREIWIFVCELEYWMEYHTPLPNQAVFLICNLLWLSSL